LKEKAPKLLEDAVPALVKPGDLQKVLQGLLRERVPIRDLETIIETLSDWAPHTSDPEVLVEYVRNALRRTICAQYAVAGEQGAQQIHCVTMDPAVEDQINAYVDRTAGGTTVSIPPQLGGSIGRAAAEAVRPLVEAGHRAVIVASPSVRAQVRQIVLPHLPDAVVLGYNEITPGMGVESLGLVQLRESEPVPA
jgi:flagellar biosynthesis protein FlhA